MNIVNDAVDYKALHIASHIDIAKYKSYYSKDLVSSTPVELYYQFNNRQFLFVLNYGVVVFANLSMNDISGYLKTVKQFCENWEKVPSEDDLHVVIKNMDCLEITFETLTLGRFDHETNKVIMLHLAQSVSLDHYNQTSQKILGELKEFTNHLAEYGKIRLKQKDSLRLAGRSLATKNSIAENLYILDSPDTAWEDEYLNQLHKKLTIHFEQTQRYRAIENVLKIIEDNLSVVISYHDHKESSRLEWIIIILIVIEVVDTLLSKVF